MYYIRTAYWKEPFNGTDGILLRKAICYALNRTEMVEGAFNGYATPATDSMVLCPSRPDVPKCCGKGYDYDIEKAKELLSEAGWNDTDGDGILDKDGKSLKDLDFAITSSTDLIWQKDLATIVQSQLNKIGIDIKIRTLEWADYSELAKTGDFDLCMAYSQGGAFSSPWELKGFSYQPKEDYINRYFNQNQTLATIAANALAAISEKERDNYLCQACNILYEEAGTIPLVYEMQYALMRSEIKGFYFGGPKYWQDHEDECWIED
jgi:peptide/nickel transport system substrate-binding protein